MPSPISPVHNLLLRCLRREIAGAVWSLESDQWSALIAAAAEQRVSGLLFDRLTGNQLAARLPPPALQTLAGRSRQIAARSLAFQRDLRLVLAALDEVGIPAIVLKGAHLAGYVYPNAGLREMNDLDLLVHRADALRAAGALQALGYDFSVGVNPEGTLAYDHHLPRMIKRRAASVEVHVLLLPPRDGLTVDIDGLWMRARPLAPGSRHLTLAPEDLLLHICIHSAYGHLGEFGLRPLCDVTTIVETFPSLDWPAICQRAAEWRAARGIFLTLYLAVECLGADVPASVLAAMRPADFDDVLGRLGRVHLFTRKSLSASLSMDATRTYGSRATSRKIRHALKRVFISRAELARQFPDGAASAFPVWGYIKRLVTGIRRNTGLAATIASGRDPELTAMIERRNALDRWLDVERPR